MEDQYKELSAEELRKIISSKDSELKELKSEFHGFKAAVTPKLNLSAVDTEDTE